MRTRWIAAFFVLSAALTVRAAEPAKAEAMLQLDGLGPTARVTALAFTKDGNTLHAAGYDKVVRTWAFDGKRFVRREQLTYRIPVGPGALGNINALSLSSDDAWLAVGGVGLVREAAGFREPGIVLPATGRLDDEMRQDLGTIYVFNRAEPEKVKALRGHRGPVLALAFVRGQAAQAKILVSYGLEFDGDKEVGVLRVWDVEKGKEVAERKARTFEAPGRTVQRPGLVAQGTGEGELNAVAAVAQRDGKLRVWDLGTNEFHADLKEIEGNDVVLAVGKNKLLTGGLLVSGGFLQTWTARSGDKPKTDTKERVSLGKSLWPRCAASGAADVIAAVVRQTDSPKGKEAYRLQLIQEGKVSAEQALWTGGEIHPVVAAVPGGRFVAAAGNLTHDIHIYDITDLLKGNKEPFHQVVQSLGTWWQSVAFVKKDKAVGLLLSANPEAQPKSGEMPKPPAKGDVIFDFAANKTTADIDDWKLDCAAPAEGITLPILAQGQIRTAWASLPIGNLKMPLLAQAFQERGQTYLFLHNAKTGDMVRLCTGHLNAVSALAFSKDGRLLASVSEDQTICVWSLTDLDKTIAKQGLLRGLVVRSSGGKLVVGDLDAKGLSDANRKALEDAGIKADAQVEALVEGDKVRELKDMREFYQAVWMSAPGAKITLRFGGKSVTLTVDQGIDERKPLFTLFLTRGGDWIGWNPQGPYDRSAEEAESWIGWHQNSGKPATPVTFAAAKEYRGQYYRKGLLEKLLSNAELGAALLELDKQKLPDPVVRVELRENDKVPQRKDARGVAVVQQRPLELVVQVDNLVDNQVNWVKWRIDGGEWAEFDRQHGTEFRHDLSAAPWKRGVRTIEVRLRTRDNIERTESLAIAYVPVAPKLNFPAQWLKQFGDTRQTAVTKKDFAVESTVEVARGETAKLSFWLNGKLTKEAEKDSLSDTLQLKEGRNELIVRAINAGAAKGEEAGETVERVFTIDFTAEPGPQIALESVTPAEEGGNLPRESVTVIVHQEDVRIRGVIVANEVLTEATLDGKALPNFKANEEKKYVIDLTRKLEAGEQTLVFKAKAKDSPETTWKLTIEFLPELPAFVLRKLNELEGLPGDTKEVILEGQLTPLGNLPYEFLLLAGDKKIGFTPDTGKQTFRVKVPVAPGANTLGLQVKLKDRTRVLRVRAYVKRPPVIGSFKTAGAVYGPVVKLEAEVETADNVDLSSIVLTGAGAPRTFDPAKDAKKGAAANGVQKWIIQMADVPLVPEKENELVLSVGNRDGAVEKSLTLKGPKRVAKVATVTLLDPKVDLNVDVEKFAVRVAVKSDSRLKRFAVLRDDEEVANLDVKDPETVLTVNVALKAGPNVIEVVAVNDGGEARSERRTISRRADTVFLHIDKLALRSGSGKEVKPVRTNDKLVIAAVEGGELVLHGRVRWLDERDEIKQPQLVRVSVNGFEQFPAGLEAVNDKLERTFRVAIRLNQEKNNRIVLALPGLKVDQTTPLEVTVEKCAKPEKEQRLHLLIVGVGVEGADQGKLVDNVLEVFQARNKKKGNTRNLVVKEFETPVFKEGRVYGPMAGDATKQEVYAMLEHISETVRSEQGQMNEVLVVYFQGQRSVTQSNYFLLTQQAQLLGNYQRAALTRDGLRGAIGKTLGAQLLLLDVTQLDKNELQPEPPTDFQRIGTFEYTWLRDNPPDNGRLLEALKASMTQARLLNEVKDKFSVRGNQLREKEKGFFFNASVPEILGQMAVGSGN